MKFTKEQILAIQAKTDSTLTVEEYAETMGFEIAEDKPQAIKAKRPVGQTAVVVVYSQSEGTALVTTNTGFAGRTDEWIINDWKKTVAGSRKSDKRFSALVNADDVAVFQSPLMDCITSQDKEYIDELTASAIDNFNENGYEFISKIKSTIQALVLQYREMRAKQAQDDAVLDIKYYTPVLGATGFLDNPYKYNNKSGKFTKRRAKA